MASERDIFYSLVKKHFRGGFNPASIIDRKKFARLAESTPAASWDEAALSRAGEETCVRVGDKFYAVGADAEAFLQNLFIYLERGDFGAVFYEPLFREYAAQFLEMGVASVEVLKSFLARFPLACEDDFLLLRDESVRDEIARKLAGEIYVPTPRIAEIFPFIPAEVVKIFAKKLNFSVFRNSLLAFDKFEFIENEWERELKRVAADIKEKDYSFLNEIDMSETRSLHDDIPEAVFKEILNLRLMEKGLRIRGPAIVPAGGGATLTEMTRDYCKRADNFSFASLLEEFGDGIKTIRHLPEIAQKAAIQIDSEHFVNPSKVYFDTDATDKILRELIPAGVSSVLAFSSFSLLPPANDYEWNGFLLQSYCVHSSERFGLIQPAPNNAQIGIIYDKEKFNSPDYHKLIAAMALIDKMTPDPENVSKYLSDNKFFFNVRKSAVLKIINYMNESV